MAKIETTILIKDNFEEVINYITKEICTQNKNTSLEEYEDVCINNVKCSVRTFKCYSLSTVSQINMTAIFLFNIEKNELLIIGTSSGNSQCLTKKVIKNEDRLLVVLANVIREYQLNGLK